MNFMGTLIIHQNSIFYLKKKNKQNYFKRIRILILFYYALTRKYYESTRHIANGEKELKQKLETTYLDIAIPSNVENLQLPDPTLLQFYKNYDDRIIWIDDEITTMTLEYAKMIMQWNSEDKKNNISAEERKPIKVIFFSPGGDLEVNNCLVDTIQLSQTKVIGINVGMAASSGCFIYLACHERFTFPTAEFLIHKGAGQFAGTYNDVVAAILNYQL